MRVGRDNNAIPRRLLFLSHSYPSNVDDMRGSFFIPLIQRLRKEGIHVDVITPCWGKKGEGVFTQKGLAGEEVCRFRWAGHRLGGLSMKNPGSFIYFFSLLRRWRRVIRDQAAVTSGWDAVIAAWAMPAGMLLRAPQLKNLPSAIWWLGTDFNRFDSSLFGSILRWLAAGAQENWANSHRMVDGIRRRAGVNADFVPLVNLPRADFCNGNSKLNEPVRLLSIGRLEPVKGLDSAIRAVSGLLDRGRNLNYNIVGEGIQRPILEDLIGIHGCSIKLLGHLSNEDLRKELAKADFILLPSRQEGMPLVFFEALAAGKPLVATDVGDVKQCLDGSMLGLVSPPEDIEALQTNIEHALSGRVRFDPRKARRVFSDYSIDKTVLSIKQLIYSEEKHELSG